MAIPRSFSWRDDDLDLEEAVRLRRETAHANHRPVQRAPDVDEVFSRVEGLPDISFDDDTFDDSEDEVSLTENVQGEQLGDSEESMTSFDKNEEAVSKKTKDAIPEARKKEKGKETSDFVEGGKLKPFGSRKGEKRVSDFDAREDLKKRAKTYQYVITAGLLAVVAFGAYNALKPVDTLSAEEVESIAQLATGSTGFPAEEGLAFAESYLTAYLTNDGSAESASKLEPYGGELSPGVKGDFSPNLAYGPKLTKQVLYGANSAQYIFEVAFKVAKDDGETLQWSQYAVNVYYDEVNDTYSVVSQPVVVPAQRVGDSSAVPDGKNLSDDGEGYPDQELSREVYNVVLQYLKEYAKASPGKTESLEQYLISDPPSKLLNGLNDAYKVGDTPTIEAWERSDGTVAVVATVELTRVGGKGEVVNLSKYAIRLVNNDGRYLVKDINPLGYAPVD